MIDDLIYDLGEDVARRVVFKFLEKNEYDYDTTLDALINYAENREQKRRIKQLNDKKKNDTETIPWPTTDSPKKQQKNKKIDENNKKGQRKDSVNIDIKRKESKKLHSNFKKENNDKTFWNNKYPLIEYPE